MTRPMLLLLGLTALPGCGGCNGAKVDDATRSAQARERVERLFALGWERDCAELIPLVKKIETPEQCTAYLDEVIEHQLKLIEVTEVRVDGRDDNAFIVRTTIDKGGTPKELLIRAEWSPDGWALVF